MVVKSERIRVAAYCRVSTDGDEQLGSFESQKLYYEQKISENHEWVNAGIFADEAITGTKTDKREGFLDMIDKCQSGEIDLILTKSISRFARNTVDTLNYVRMLKGKNIAVIFEKENLNTLDMNGEMLLTILSSLAHVETVVLLSQQHVDHHIEVDLDLDELDITSAETKATYNEIQQYVLKETGLMVSNLYIAQVKKKCGIEVGESFNKPKSENAKQPKCPQDKEKAIKDALKHFGMI